MSFQSSPDIPLLITTPSASTSIISSERRVTPSWTLFQLKGKLEPVTGIPPGSQRLRLRVPGREEQWMEDDEAQVGEWGLARGTEIEVHDTRPLSLRQNLTDVSSVEKFNLPTTTYESLPNTVLSWKKANHLGRFDPSKPNELDLERERAKKDQKEITERDLALNRRCILLPQPSVRRGTIRFIGPVPTIPSQQSPETSLWIGIELDEPMGKNDGSVGGKRYFGCGGEKRGVFVKAEKVLVGDFPPLGLDDDDDGDDMEEI